MPKNDAVEEPIGRGRPRPIESIERDEKILKLLKGKTPMTRNQIADKLDLRRGLVYLSLDRLRKEGRIDRIENDSRFVWRGKR